jgi:ubiquinol-cytochrome c reductase cytochrome c subunit
VGVRAAKRIALSSLLLVPVVVGMTAAFAVPRGAASGDVDDARDVGTVYRQDCAVCHGGEGGGSRRGPSLLHSGRAGVYYYVSTGRMPLDEPGATPRRHDPRYSPAMIERLVDYIAVLQHGAGPEEPRLDLTNADLATGGELFRLNCAACHSWAGTGGALSNRQAPSLKPSTPRQIAAAIRFGPGYMPAFGTAAISDAQLSDVVAATVYAAHPRNRGGFPLGHLGPLAEGAVAIVVALGLLVFFTRWIGTRE